MYRRYAVYRNILVGILGIGMAAGSVHAQQADDYPSKPIRMIVPFSAGGSADTLARMTGQKLNERWKQQILIDNRPGAGGNIGAQNRQNRGQTTISSR